MSNTIIKVENLSKKYQIGSRESYYSLRDKISGIFDFKNKEKKEKGEFWALNDVNFEVKQGESVGIIGRNGAGKSTLLKVLSQITPPTTGKITMKGRVASLLEVGTGFNPELTGRENIFLNGAILGMTREEIKRKFDEIVAFAEIEKFLDTPVKRYSSGMYMRLAFSVAAHLESEILIVDEVLAVGDTQFQKKCLGKMNDVTKNEGRTVLFVSHNMGAIQQLCNKVVYLKDGSIFKNGDNVQGIINGYSNEGVESGKLYSEWLYKSSDNKLVNPWFKPNRLAITNKDGKLLKMPLSNDQEMFVTIEGEISEVDPALTVGYAIYSSDGLPLYWSYQTDVEESKWPRLVKGKNVLRSQIPKRLLNDGKYRVELISSLHFRKWLCEPGKSLPSVGLHINGGLSDSPYMMTVRPTILSPVLTWF